MGSFAFFLQLVNYIPEDMFQRLTLHPFQSKEQEQEREQALAAQQAHSADGANGANGANGDEKGAKANGGDQGGQGDQGGGVGGKGEGGEWGDGGGNRVAMVVTGAVAAKVCRVKAAGGRQARWTLALRVKGKHKSLF